MIVFGIIAAIIIISAVSVSAIRRAQARRPATTYTSPPGTPPPPAPAPTATPTSRKYSWLTPALVVIALIAIGWWLPKQGTTPSNNPAPRPFAQAPAPAKTKCTPRFLDFAEGEKAIKKGSGADIQAGGRALFQTLDLPWRPDAIRFQVVAEIKQERTGNVYIQVNGNSLRPIPVTGGPVYSKVVFNEKEGMAPQIFNDGLNYVNIWGSNTISVKAIKIEMIHPQ
jgi:hypothetical protein